MVPRIKGAISAQAVRQVLARLRGRPVTAGPEAQGEAPVAIAAPPVTVTIPDPDDWTDAQLEALVKGKARPQRIYEDGDKIAFYLATDAEREAWNAYAKGAAQAFNANPSLDSYDSVDVYPGFTQDGRQTPWIPPVRFPEWLASRREPA